MAEKTKIGKNSTPANANLGCIPPQTITRQPIELDSCSNPVKMGKVLYFSMKNKHFRFGCRFFIDLCVMEVCLCIFCLH